MDNINAKVAGLAPYQPGKPIEELARELGIRDAIKLASNENPRGPGPAVRAALGAGVDDLSRYPDGSGYRLKNALSEHLGVEPAQITLGNGSNDVLDLAAKVALTPGTKGIVDQYCFVVYPLAITAAGGEIVRVPSKDWGHDLDGFAEAIDANTRIIYIANPNNPTGTWLEARDFEAFMGRVPENIWVVLDEAYFEYVDDDGHLDGIALVREYDNLIVTRTFSKIHGLAALRVGYAVSSPTFADLMNRVRHPFNVNSLALAAAEAALNDSSYAEESKHLCDQGIGQIEAGLAELGLNWIPSKGNFITFEVEDAPGVYDKLLHRGVIVRPVANYGMPRHLRVTVGLAEENVRFLAALAESI